MAHGILQSLSRMGKCQLWPILLPGGLLLRIPERWESAWKNDVANKIDAQLVAVCEQEGRRPNSQPMRARSIQLLKHLAQSTELSGNNSRA